MTQGALLESPPVSLNRQFWFDAVRRNLTAERKGKGVLPHSERDCVAGEIRRQFRRASKGRES